MVTAERVFLANGLLRRALMNGGWLPLSVLLVVELEFTALQLLLMGTAIELSILLGEIPTGVIADMFSRKWSVVLGSFFLSIAQLASGIVDEWHMFLVTQFVWGIGWTCISGAEIAWITDEVGDVAVVEPLILRRGRLALVAIVAGTIVFGTLTLIAPLATTVMIAGGIGLVWTCLLALAMPETGFVSSRHNGWSTFTKTLRHGAVATLRSRGLRVLGIALVAAGVGAEAIDRLDVRRLEDLGLSTAWSPVLLFGFVIVSKSMLGALLLWRFEGRFVGIRVVHGFALLLGLVGIGVLLLAHLPFLAFAVGVLVVQGGLLDMTEPLVATWTNALAPTEVRATVHSFIGQARAVGEIAGGVGLGAVAQAFTLPVAWTVAAGIFLLAAGYSRTATRDWPAPAAS